LRKCREPHRRRCRVRRRMLGPSCPIPRRCLACRISDCA